MTPAGPQPSRGPSRPVVALMPAHTTLETPASTRDGNNAALEAAPASVRLQILSAEHWSLLATRSLTWNESFARAQVFLSVLSGAVIGLALVAQATAFGAGFIVFALVILPVVLFVGVATFVRLVAVNSDEARWVIGMNLIRAAYLELAPELEPYFVTGYHDDEKGLMVTAGYDAFPTLYGYVTTPAVVGVIDAVVAAMIVFLAAGQLHVAIPNAAALGLLTFVACNVALTRYVTCGRRKQALARRAFSPTPPDEA